MVVVLPALLGTPINMMAQVGTEIGELDPVAGQGVQMGISFGLQMVFMPLQMLASAGLITAVGHVIATGEVSIAMLYNSVGAAVRALLYGVLAGVIGFFVSLLFLSPGIGCLVGAAFGGDEMMLPLIVAGSILILVGLIAYIPVWLGLMLGVLPAVLDRAGPTEALALSWEAARGNRVQLFVVLLVFGLLSGIGACCCYLPAVPVLGAQWAGLSAAWLRYSRPKETTDSWGFFQRNGG
ncbi:MAG: hypothetical protein ACI9K2_006952 [Myxococcota bacterium]